MKNKNARKMLVDIKMKGRKLFWFGEDSEVFVANSLEQLLELYGHPDPDFPVDIGDQISNPYKILWGECYYDDDGEWVKEPIFKFIYGDNKDDCQLLSDYC